MSTYWLAALRFGICLVVLAALGPSVLLLAQHQIFDKTASVVLPSPTAASLGQYGDIPVSLYTGTPQISIPLHTLEGYGLRVPISLSYHASGIRVSQEAGAAGLGWSLNAGGVITRVMRGLPDDVLEGYIHTRSALTQQAWNYLDDETLSCPITLPTTDPRFEACQYLDRITRIVSINEQKVDPHPDIFLFNFNGYSGKFVIDHDGTNPVIYTIPHQMLAIDYVESGPVNRHAGNISKWIVTTPDGTRYTFGQDDLQLSTSQKHEETRLFNPAGTAVTVRYKSAWYLASIESPSGDDTITFTYTSSGGNGAIQPPTTAPDKQSDQKEWRYENGGLTDYPVAGVPPWFEQDEIYVTEITAAKGRLTFELERRADQSSWENKHYYKALKVYTPDSQLQKTISLTYDYFTASSIPPEYDNANYRDRVSKRLRLTGVSIVPAHNATAPPPHTFTYYGSEGDAIRLPHTMTKAEDHWGYYNGRHENEGLSFVPNFSWTHPDLPGFIVNFTEGANREPDATGAYMQVGSLKQITYPTGGHSTFYYEPHQYSVLGGDPNEPLPGGGDIATAGGLRIKKIVSHDGLSAGNDITKEFSYAGDKLFDLRGYGNDNDFSSGVLVTSPRYLFWGKYDWGIDFISAFSSDLNTLGSGSHLGYRQVTEYTSGSGQSVHFFLAASGEYHSTSVWAHDVIVGRAPTADDNYRLQREYMTSYDWKRGLPLLTIHYAEAGHKVQQTKHTYYFADTDPSFQSLTHRLPALNYTVTEYTVSPGDYYVSYYQPYQVISSLTLPHTMETTTFDASGASSTKTTTFAYERLNEHLHPTTITETNSDGTERISTFTYASEQYGGMKAKNMRTQLFSTAVSERKDATTTPLSKTWTAWSAMGNYWRPQAEWVWAGAAPDPPTTLPTLTSQTDCHNAEHTPTWDILCVAYYDAYDQFGHVLKQTDGRGTETQFFFGDNTNIFCNQDGPGLCGTFQHSLLTGIKVVDPYTLVEPPPPEPDEDPKTFPDEGVPQTFSIEYTYFTDYRWGLVHTARDPSVRTTEYTYDGLQRLTEVKEANLLLQSYAYATHPFSSTTPQYVETTTYHDATRQSKARAFVDGLGRIIQTQAQESGANYYVTGTAYDGYGRPFRSWKPYPAPTNGAFQPNFAADAQSYYDTLYDVTTDPTYDQSVPYQETRYMADPLHRTKETIPVHLALSNGTPPKAVMYTYGVDNQATFVSITDEDGHSTRTYNDSFGQTIKTIAGYATPEAATTTYVYDGQGQTTRVTNTVDRGGPVDLHTRYAYDERGQLVTKVTPDADGDGDLNPTNEDLSTPDFRYAYDVNGNLRFSQDANQQMSGTVAFTTYDGFSRPLIQGEAQSSFSGLDANSTPTFETEPANWHQVSQYDTKPDPNTFPWTLLSSAEWDELALNYTQGRLVASAFHADFVPPPTPSSGGLVLQQQAHPTDGWVLALYSYDALGRLETLHQELGPLGRKTTQYTYDRQGAVTAIAYQAGEADAFYLWYTYDSFGRLATVASNVVNDPTEAGGAVVEACYAYRATGQVEQLLLGDTASDGTACGTPTVLTFDYQYHIRDWLTQINNPAVADASTLFALRLYYDESTQDGMAQALPGAAAYMNNGNVAALEWVTHSYPRASYAFAYDDLNRLTEGRFNLYAGGHDWINPQQVYNLERVTYDASGNITALDRKGHWDEEETPPQTTSTALTFHYEQGNRLKSLSGDLEVAYDYDPNGNVIRGRGIDTLTYDHRNLPLSMRLPDTAEGNKKQLWLRYDAAGQRIGKGLLAKQEGCPNDDEPCLSQGWYYVRGADGAVLAVYDSYFQLRYWNLLAGGVPIGRAEPTLHTPTP